MSRTRAVVAEDEEPQRSKLCELLGELWPELQIVAQCDDGLSALEALTGLEPQIAFLDIRMPGLSGLEVARAAAPTVHVVFTTAYDEYAVSAFERGAIDYLLKPVGRDRLAQSVLRLKARVAGGGDPSSDVGRSAGAGPNVGGDPNARAAANLHAVLDALQRHLRPRSRLGAIRWITGSTGSVTKMFGIEEVLFFQAQDKYVRVATAEDEVHVRTPLKDLLESLDPEEFWRVHRSVIVRAAAIHRIETSDEGGLRLRVRGRPDVLPVSSAFQYRFKPM